MPLEEIVMVCCSDIAGQVRGKGMPARLLQERRARGVGWTPTNIMITAHGPIADSPWGALGDLMLVPDLDTHVRVDFEDDEAAEQFVLGDLRQPDGNPWDCCPRDFLRRGLTQLREETGLTVKAAFEHEFHYDGVEERANSPYNLDAHRRQGSFAETFLYALESAGLEADSFMPEYGPCQYEVTVAPSLGLRAADNAVILREMARASAYRLGARASFTPILRPGAVGNGVHLHFSLLEADSGAPANHDPGKPHGIATRAGAFIAGILDKLPALVAVTAASTISYQRLVPHRWSAAFNNLGLHDREAAVRVCPVFETAIFETAEAGRAAQFHFEFRAADAAASPYLLFGALVWAGLDGLRRNLGTPSATEEDLSALDAGALAERDLVRLPQSLGEALERFAADEDLKDWMGPPLHDAYLRHKRFENDMLSALSPEEQCARYLQVY